MEDAGMLPMPGSGDYYSGSGSEEFSGSGDLSGSGSGDGAENSTLPQFSYTTGIYHDKFFLLGVGAGRGFCKRGGHIIAQVCGSFNSEIL